MTTVLFFFFFFSSRRRHTRLQGDWSSDVCSSDLGRRPIVAYGNSDGDLEMLQWTTMTAGRRLGVIVHHTDAEREYAYDRATHFGRLDKALEAASVNGWTVVDMRKDWKRVFAFE